MPRMPSLRERESQEREGREKRGKCEERGKAMARIKEREESD